MDQLSSPEITLRKIFMTWWPLAASWLLMAFEGPLVSAVIARMENPELNLAAFGSVVEPLRSLTVAPMVMLLAASTALSKDKASYLKIRRFLYVAGSILTILHFLLAFTPLYNLVVRNLLGIPSEIVPMARYGLMIMLPLPLSVGYRRFQQGVMIRNGAANAVVVGTFVRLISVSTILIIGALFTRLTGVMLAASALTSGMFCEALYTHWRVKPILRLLPPKSQEKNELTWRSFAAFYLPLILTSFLTMIWRPIGSAAISRMPVSLESLAVWPVVGGLIFLFQTMGISYNEVVVAMLDRQGSSRNIRRFAFILFGVVSLFLLIFLITPLSTHWFTTISALPATLLPYANSSLWYLLPIPGIAVLLSLFQGSILYSRKTRAIPEAVVVFLLSMISILTIGVVWGKIPGVYIGAVGFTAAVILQACWLGYRAYPILKEVAKRDR